VRGNMGCAGGASAGRVVAMLNLPKGFPVVVMLNGSSCSDPEPTVLGEGDIVLVPPVLANR